MPLKPRFLRRFFSLQRKRRAALCVTKCSYPGLLLSRGSYASKKSHHLSLFALPLSFLIQRFLTYLFYYPIQSGKFFSISLPLSPSSPSRGSYRENFIFFLYLSACSGPFPPLREFYCTIFQSKSPANRDSYRKKTAFAPLPCCLH